MTDTAKKMMLCIAGLTAAALIIGLIAGIGTPLKYTLALLLGSAFSIGKIWLMERTLEKSLKMEKKSAENYARAMYIGRYFLTAIILVVSAVFLNLWGGVIGVFSLQISAYLVQLFKPKELQGGPPVPSEQEGGNGL